MHMNQADIMANLLQIDPSQIRQGMHTAEYNGSDPAWANLELSDTIHHPIDEKDPASLMALIERLKRDKRDLAAELERTQQLLKIQYDLEKEQKKLTEQDMELIKTENDARSK